MNWFTIVSLFFAHAHSQTISKLKCFEYADAVYVKDFDVRGRPTKRSECALVSVPLIIGGNNVIPKEFPHMALIGFGEDENSKLAWECGGSLISENFVLTAAHCMHSRASGNAQKVRLGLINKSDFEQEITILNSFPHPKYNSSGKMNDIALLELSKNITLTPFTRPACLDQKRDDLPAKAIATGFGKTTWDGDSGSENLLKVTLDILDRSHCVRTYKAGTKYSPLRGGVLDSMICAGVLLGGKDTCQGDSGGPLQVALKEPYCMYDIVGITSFGKFCGFANVPAIYTKVSSYIPWIESIVWP